MYVWYVYLGTATYLGVGIRNNLMMNYHKHSYRDILTWFHGCGIISVCMKMQAG